MQSKLTRPNKPSFTPLKARLVISISNLSESQKENCQRIKRRRHRRLGRPLTSRKRAEAERESLRLVFHLGRNREPLKSQLTFALDG